ncbi:hypothetical protein IQ235_04560 [Oscillatoriales cyanobacterium LEGE 11467]|uniref:Uncharacterized protein n=1 Tax=Zarconia navalis LEGE 11467 TaxID=1828826 RepID=A0A928VXQ0_9CYAN|nr:hypothetical protein [Zarconia navalis]MBE9040063.1 hypothetical protein [Zarconia navalis LEGE 11467]
MMNSSVRILVTALGVTFISTVRALSPLPGTLLANAHHNPVDPLDAGETEIASVSIETIVSQNGNSDDNNSQPPGSSRR